MKGKKTTIILSEGNYRRLKVFPLPITPFINMILDEFFKMVDLEEIQRIWLEMGERETEKYVRELLTGKILIKKEKSAKERKPTKGLEEKFKGFFESV